MEHRKEVKVEGRETMEEEEEDLREKMGERQ